MMKEDADKRLLDLNKGILSELCFSIGLYPDSVKSLYLTITPAMTPKEILEKLVGELSNIERNFNNLAHFYLHKTCEAQDILDNFDSRFNKEAYESGLKEIKTDS